MAFMAYNRFDERWFEFESDEPAGSELNIIDAVLKWNQTHDPYFEIGYKCISKVIPV